MEKHYNEIERILSEKDEILALIITSNGSKIKPHPSVDVFSDLLKSIVSQQLSVKVAEIIWKRFLDLFPKNNPSAKLISLLEVSELRNVGLSNSKASYIKNVAEFSLINDLSFDTLINKTDDEIIKLLTQIKGVGKWTVQMILMFSLDRPNVFPIDDLAVRSKMKQIYQVNKEKKELRDELTLIAEKWEPYRSLACKHIWHYKVAK